MSNISTILVFLCVTICVASQGCSGKGTQRSTDQKRSDYTYIDGIGAYKLRTPKATWENARKSCMEDGAQLAVINTEEEAQALAKMLVHSWTYIRGPDRFYDALLGFHDLGNNGKFVTIYGNSLESTGYTKWEKGQPDNKGHCGALLGNGNLVTVNCSERYGYFCELPTIEQ